MKNATINTGEIQEITNILGIHVKDLAESAVNIRGKFTMALSGGSSMEMLSQALLKNEIKEEIDWTKWHVFWADERCVSEDNLQSNYGRAKKLLFDHVEIPENQIHYFNGTINPDEALMAYENELSEVFSGSPGGKFPRFDLIVLGLGDDGHTASLFPGHAALCEKKKTVLLIDDSPKPPKSRMTMTLPVINNACNLVIVVLGKPKASVVRKILVGDNGQILPASLVESSDGDVEWFLDHEAASELDN